MARSFKNRLCLALRPEAFDAYAHRCKRHGNHPGLHRATYSDGVAEWAGGDRVAKVTLRSTTEARNAR